MHLQHDVEQPLLPQPPTFSLRNISFKCTCGIMVSTTLAFGGYAAYRIVTEGFDETTLTSSIATLALGMFTSIYYNQTSRTSPCTLFPLTDYQTFEDTRNSEQRAKAALNSVLNRFQSFLDHQTPLSQEPALRFSDVEMGNTWARIVHASQTPQGRLEGKERPSPIPQLITDVTRALPPPPDRVAFPADHELNEQILTQGGGDFDRLNLLLNKLKVYSDVVAASRVRAGAQGARQAADAALIQTLNPIKDRALTLSGTLGIPASPPRHLNTPEGVAGCISTVVEAIQKAVTAKLAENESLQSENARLRGERESLQKELARRPELVEHKGQAAGPVKSDLTNEVDRLKNRLKQYSDALITANLQNKALQTKADAMALIENAMSFNLMMIDVRIPSTIRERWNILRNQLLASPVKSEPDLSDSGAESSPKGSRGRRNGSKKHGEK